MAKRMTNVLTDAGLLEQIDSWGFRCRAGEVDVAVCHQIAQCSDHGRGVKVVAEASMHGGLGLSNFVV